MIERTPDPNAVRRFGYRLDLVFGQQNQDTATKPIQRTAPATLQEHLSGLRLRWAPNWKWFTNRLRKVLERTRCRKQLLQRSAQLLALLLLQFPALLPRRTPCDLQPEQRALSSRWLVNGANQTEHFNGFESQAALLTVKPNSNISWNLNYYEGQQQSDVVAAYNPGVPLLPTQPGLSIDPVATRRDGRLHVIDSYASFNLGSKWSATVEGDYVTNRVAATSAPARVYGDVGYLHRQISKSVALNGRFEYVANRGGLFGGMSQDLKDATGTPVYQLIDGFETRLKYRRDFSNRSFFLTNNALNPAYSQNTLAVGMLWWFGGKQGLW